MKKHKCIQIIFLMTIFIFILQIKVFGFSTEDKIQKLEYSNDYIKWMNLSEEEKKKSIMPRKYETVVSEENYNTRNSGYTRKLLTAKLMVSNYDKYDLRDYINIKVRNQGTTGACWALATNSIIETNIAKTTGGNSPLFSARYTEYATSKTFLDGENPIAYNREVGKGGYGEIALGLYTSGNGPVLEEDLPFENNQNKINLSEIEGLETQKQIKDYVRIPGIYKTYDNGKVTYQDGYGDVYTSAEVKQIRNQIKEHIINYGAVISETYGVGGTYGYAQKYYNKPEDMMSATAYFCNNENVEPDHQIAIIGWDDNYAVSNFNKNYRPSTPGAYIVLNSWGKEFGENGVYYVSYEDYFIEKDILGIVSTSDIEYDNIYQYDELGNNYAIASRGDIYGANVFERDASTDTEWLTKVSVSNLVDMKCEIYVNSTDGELSLNKFQKVADNLELKNGYHTIELDEPVELTGDKFAIVVKYLADESGNAFIGLEHPDEYYWGTASAARGQSYLSSDFYNWDDIMDLSTVTIIPSESNLCIKAFTEYKEESNYFKIRKYKMNKEYIFNISPKTKISELINNISTDMEYYIYDKNNKIVSEGDFISTGMKLKNGSNTYKIIVNGDVNGDGKVTITDVVKVRLHMINIRRLTDEFFEAGDINNDKKITITDLVNVNLASVNLKRI